MKSARDLVEEALSRVHTRSAAESLALLGDAGVVFVDLREAAELQRVGRIPGAFHAPRGVLEFWADPASEWQRPELCRPGTELLLFCAVGWRSALAARALQEMGRSAVSHVGGGIVAWQAAGGAVLPPADG